MRVNTLKSNVNEIIDILNENDISYDRVKWYKDALIINNISEDGIRKLSIYEEGKIYMQSLSSMIPALVVKPQNAENILDMTAAPGGKTTQMLALSNNLALITACEKNKIRAERLKYNLEKQGASKVNVLLQDARSLSEYFSFDKILLDAPCSGSGTINLEDKNIEQIFTEDLINRSIKLQFDLLNNAINMLKPGHELIYSTCSILKDENENNLLKVLKIGNVEIVQIDEKLFEDIPMLPSSVSGTLCVLPNDLYEGFFVAKLRKK